MTRLMHHAAAALAASLIAFVSISAIVMVPRTSDAPMMITLA
ncbi:MAG: hypothetical protein ABIT16_03855 [Croceibacterium sp.]